MTDGCTPRPDEPERRRAAARGRIPSLDGLRGLAILVVLIHNVGFFEEPADSLVIKLMRVSLGAGWVGVQLFFVLSGFLITGILLDTRNHPSYFRSFYVRRTLRIFPLYYSTLVVAFLVLPHLLDLGEWGAHANRVQAWYWTYLVNWEGYDLRGLGHFWSLALEEQFYVVWPVVVLLLPIRRLIQTCGLLMVTALAARTAMVAAHDDPTLAYSLTVARWDALACGALVAITMRDPAWYDRMAWWLRRTWIPLGAVLLAITVRGHGLRWDDPWSQTAGYSALALLCGFLILEVVDPDGRSQWLTRATEAGWLRFFGKYSYGMYVLHVPINQLGHWWFGRWVVGGTAFSRPVQLFVYIGANLLVSTAAALASWVIVERPFLALKDVLAPRTV